MFLGLRSVMYPAADLQASKAWFSGLLGTAPYFDEPFYVGFNVGGYELGLIPAADGESTTYWGVPDAEVALSDLIAAGATLHSEVTDVGDGIRVATVREPAGSILGVIENPHFVISAPQAAGRARESEPAGARRRPPPMWRACRGRALLSLRRRGGRVQGRREDVRHRQSRPRSRARRRSSAIRRKPPPCVSPTQGSPPGTT